VTLATFYRHFPSKQDLILAYLQRVHDDYASRAAAAQEAAEDPGDMLRSIGTNITAQLLEPGFRGCHFINAASEFEDPQGPILRAVLTHRAWFHDLVRDAFATAGHPQPDLAAGHYVMLRDGATTAGHLGDPHQARDTFQRALAGAILVLADSVLEMLGTRDLADLPVTITATKDQAGRLRRPRARGAHRADQGDHHPARPPREAARGAQPRSRPSRPGMSRSTAPPASAWPSAATPRWQARPGLGQVARGGLHAHPRRQPPGARRAQVQPSHGEIEQDQGGPTGSPATAQPGL